MDPKGLPVGTGGPFSLLTLSFPAPTGSKFEKRTGPCPAVLEGLRELTRVRQGFSVFERFGGLSRGRIGPGGSTGLQNQLARLEPGWVGSIPTRSRQMQEPARVTGPRRFRPHRPTPDGVGFWESLLNRRVLTRSAPSIGRNHCGEGTPAGDPESGGQRGKGPATPGSGGKRTP